MTQLATSTIPATTPPASPTLPWGWIAIYGAILAAWAAVWAGTGTAEAEAWLLALCGPDAAGAGWPALFAMWALMGAAMMLPTALPALVDYRSLAETAAARGGEARPEASVVALAAGYLAVWLGFALIAASLQLALSLVGIADVAGGPGSLWVAALLCLLAGAYQFSPLKAACLSRCRAPLAQFIGRWRPGPAPAFGFGLRLGADCLGCCWALMAIGLAGGLHSVGWMGLATLLMALEKLPTVGRPVTPALGLVLLGIGLGAGTAATI